MGAPVVRFPIIIVIRVVGIAVSALLLTWTLHFRGGLALISDNKDLIFNVHPVLMVISLVLLNGEGRMSRLPFGKGNPFFGPEPTPSTVIPQSRPSASFLANQSRHSADHVGEKHDKGGKRKELADASKAQFSKKNKAIIQTDSPGESVATTFGTLAANNYSNDDAKMWRSRKDEDGEFNFKMGLGDVFYHGLNVLAQKNEIIVNQEKSNSRLKGEIVKQQNMVAEAKKLVAEETKARRDEVSNLQVELDNLRLEALKTSQSLEGENSKLQSEMSDLRASMRRGQGEAYNAGFLDYLRNFLAGDPEYDWATHFAPSTPTFMDDFRKDNAAVIEEARIELENKILAEKEAIEKKDEEKADPPPESSPSRTVAS